MTTEQAHAAGTISKLLVAVIVLLGTVGPLATDMYLPAFPMVARDLHTGQGPLALTLTAFFGGMGAGQLIGGPVSDQIGRRHPIIWGTIGTLLASAACALAPSIGVMLVARFAQGFCAGWAMVIGRAVLVDLAVGPQLIRVMNLIMAIGSIAPLVAPLLGALLIETLGWRYSFWAIAVMAALQLAGCLMVVPESLPPERRHAGGLARFGRNAANLVQRRVYFGYLLVGAFAGIGLFAYVTQSPLVFQTLNGLSPTQYSLVFACNSGGIVIATSLSARLAGRVPTRRVALLGMLVQLAGGLVLLGSTALLSTPLWLAWPACFCLTFGQGLIGGNVGAMASAEAPDMAGTASALLGVAMSVAAAGSPALVNLIGPSTAWPVSTLMVVAPMLCLFAFLVVARPRSTSPHPAAA